MAIMTTKKCNDCGNKFILGYDGIWDWQKKQYICDSCAGVIRLSDEYSTNTAYLPDELNRK